MWGGGADYKSHKTIIVAFLRRSEILFLEMTRGNSLFESDWEQSLTDTLK